MDSITDDSFEKRVEAFPMHVQPTFDRLRTLVHEVAQKSEISQLYETLKWGEPSFVARHGSTLRMDWKEQSPSTFALYFQCSSKLVETFKVVFTDQFSYEGKRAIHPNLGEELPIAELTECVRVTLWYHKLKHLPLLGL